MQIKQKEDLSAEIKFSWKEIWILIKKQKLTFSRDGFEVFADTLITTLLQMKIMIQEQKNKEKDDSKEI
jgi:hypothetical protein